MIKYRNSNIYKIVNISTGDIYVFKSSASKDTPASKISDKSQILNFSIHDFNIYDIKKQLEKITSIPLEKQHLFSKMDGCPEHYRNSINNRLTNDMMPEQNSKKLDIILGWTYINNHGIKYLPGNILDSKIPIGFYK